MIMIFIGLTILSIAVGCAEGSITGWIVFGVGLIVMGLIEKADS